MCTFPTCYWHSKLLSFCFLWRFVDHGTSFSHLTGEFAIGKSAAVKVTYEVGWATIEGKSSSGQLKKITFQYWFQNYTTLPSHSYTFDLEEFRGTIHVQVGLSGPYCGLRWQAYRIYSKWIYNICGCDSVVWLFQCLKNNGWKFYNYTL